MRKPDVSIVVPVFKVKEEFLRHCIQSCIDQENRDIEIILIDDCSPDLCGSICEEYALTDSRINVIHHSTNKGLSATRNTGVRNATGEWITFLDGDDWIESDMCNLAKEVLDEDIQLIFFGMYRDYLNKTEKIDFLYGDNIVYDQKECTNLQVDVLNYYRRFSTAYCKFVRRDTIEKYNIFHDEEIRCGIEGIEYSLRLLGYVNKSMSVNRYLYHYVYNLESITGAPSDTTNFYVLLGLKKIRKYIEHSGNPEKLRYQYRQRVKRVVIDTSVGCYFNPNYKCKFKERKIRLNEFLNNNEIADTINNIEGIHGNYANEIIFRFAKYRFYLGLFIIGKIREYLLSHR